MARTDLITKDFALYVVHYFAAMQTWSKQDILAEIDRTIKEAKPEDPEKRRPHGRWMQGYPISCSVCGGSAATDYEDANRYEAWLTPYCPNCGAKMEQEEVSGTNKV